jgi:Zn-dependent membrane protease YugP
LIGFSPVYLLITVVGLALSGGAALLVRSAYAQYSQVRSRRGYTGAEAAYVMLQQAGITDVEIVPVPGTLSDHYDPANKRLALSEGVYSSQSVAALGIACHEAGHAIQHATRYPALEFTSALWRPASIGSTMGMYAMMLGLMTGLMPLALIGLGAFSLLLLFQVVTLPVEFDASARAKMEIIAAGIIDADERTGVDRVLNAAALTYVAGAFSTLLYFLYYASLVLGRGSDE